MNSNHLYSCPLIQVIKMLLESLLIIFSLQKLLNTGESLCAQDRPSCFFLELHLSSSSLVTSLLFRLLCCSWMNKTFLWGPHPLHILKKIWLRFSQFSLKNKEKPYFKGIKEIFNSVILKDLIVSAYQCGCTDDPHFPEVSALDWCQFCSDMDFQQERIFILRPVALLFPISYCSARLFPLFRI